MGVGGWMELEEESEDRRKWRSVGGRVRVESWPGRRKVLGAKGDGEGLLTNLACASGSVVDCCPGAGECLQFAVQVLNNSLKKAQLRSKQGKQCIQAFACGFSEL